MTWLQKLGEKHRQLHDWAFDPEVEGSLRRYGRGLVYGAIDGMIIGTMAVGVVFVVLGLIISIFGEKEE